MRKRDSAVKLVTAAMLLAAAVGITHAIYDRISTPPLERDVSPSEIVRLLDAGQAVFGVFSGEKTAEQGGRIVENRETDFVFYSLESGPFDIPTMEVYMTAMAEAAGERAHPSCSVSLPSGTEGSWLDSGCVGPSAWGSTASSFPTWRRRTRPCSP